MRRGGPGLVGAMARTAVVVGTANAVSHRQSQKYAAQADAAQAPPEEAPAPAAAAPAAGGTDIATQIQQLGALRDQGLLTEEEFSAKKAQLLGI